MLLLKQLQFKLNKPKISCLCLTEKRLELLKRSIRCFLSQSYKNKELIVVYKDSDVATEKYINTFSGNLIKGVKVDGSLKLSLGELRNLSIQNSTGAYFCQWDDDDWYHPRRLELQIKFTINSNRSGSILSNLIIYDSSSGESYLSFKRPWENSIFCRKKDVVGKFRYPSLNKQEDTAFVENLLIGNRLNIVTHPPLYIYVFHGKNTWNQDHFNHLFGKSLKLSSELSNEIKNILLEEYNPDIAASILFGSKMLREIESSHQYNPGNRSS
jgi:glycosyltransferase involved in cell wall biosynthesis